MNFLSFGWDYIWPCDTNGIITVWIIYLGVVAYIRFSVENRRLIDVRLCLPDEYGNVIEEEFLISRMAILERVA